MIVLCGMRWLLAMLLLRQQTPFQVSRSQPGGIDTEANRNGSAPGCRGVGVLCAGFGEPKSGGEWMGYGPIRLDVPCRCLFCPPSFPGSSAQLPFEPSQASSHLGDSRRPSPSARPGPESCKSPASPDQPRPPSSRPPIIRLPLPRATERATFALLQLLPYILCLHLHPLSPKRQPASAHP